MPVWTRPSSGWSGAQRSRERPGEHRTLEPLPMKAAERKRSSRGPEKPAVLVVGQTPPPYGGQAMMIESIVNADFEKIAVHHVRMAFSPSMKSMGRFELAKVGHLLSVA